MPSIWYIARDGEVAGPISQAEFAEFLRRGHLLSSDHVWYDGLDDWLRGEDLLPRPESSAETPETPGHDRSLRGAAMTAAGVVSQWMRPRGTRIQERV